MGLRSSATGSSDPGPEQYFEFEENFVDKRIAVEGYSSQMRASEIWPRLRSLVLSATTPSLAVRGSAPILLSTPGWF